MDDYFTIHDYDDGTTTNPTRMISRDGNFQIWDGGFVIGQYADGTLADIGNGNFRVQGDVGIGDTTPDNGLKLDVEGKVGATEYCDQNGANCTPAASLGGGDGSTKPGGHYFVLSRGTYNGAMNGGVAGLAGAAMACVNELNFYEWKGRENVTVNAETVRPWLCDSANNYCENLLPSTSYAYAAAGDNTIGGATFTTNGSGAGPGDTTAWSTATKFGNSSAFFWAARTTGTSTYWGTTRYDSNECSGFTTASGGSAIVGASSLTGTNRWVFMLGNCTNSYRIICIVDDDGTGTNGGFDGYRQPGGGGE